MASLLLSDEQQALRKTARDFARERLPISAFRRLRDSRDADGFDRSAWAALAELGLVGAALPEAVGGAGLGYAELGLVFEELGKTLAATPLLASSVLGATPLQLGGKPEQLALLEGVATGQRLLALAHEEQPHFAPYAVATRAERTPGGYRLEGKKTLVLDGHVAEQLVVVARTSGEPGQRDGLSLFLVPAEAAGVSVERLALVDSRNAARVYLSGVHVDEGALVGEQDRGAELLDVTLDRGAVALAAELLGGASEAFERTIAYLKERRQFGVPIGSFQALKHRAAWMFVELELSRSIVLDALRAVDEGRADLPLVASTAKARLSDTFLHVAAEGIQLHGGIGVTDEHDIGLFYKRARVAELTLGSASYHRDRYARLSRY